MQQFAQQALTYTLPFLVVLTLVVTIHELGHFLVARLFGVAIERFSIGFGRPIVSWRDRRGTNWWLSWIPLGGYVKFAGDENAASVPDAESLAELRARILEQEGPAALRRYFHFKPLWQRALVVAAGPAANFVLAIAVFSVIAFAMGDIVVKPRVGQVQPHSPAAAAGFQAGDLILSADGRPVPSFEALTQLVVLRAGEPIRFQIERAGHAVAVVATPSRRTRAETGPNDVGGPPVGLGYLGIVSSTERGDVQIVHFGPVQALNEGVRRTGEIVGGTVTYVGRIFMGRESGSQLSSMLGMAKVTGQVANAVIHQSPDLPSGAALLALNLAQMAAFISVALGFANLLPIPVLDGGHLLFYGYEAVARRPLSANIQDAGYRVGFALVIALMLFGTFNDLRRFGLFHLLGGLFS
jgi:regulator of sigma E protease